MLQQDRSCQGYFVSLWDPLKPGLWVGEDIVFSLGAGRELPHGAHRGRRTLQSGPRNQSNPPAPPHRGSDANNLPSATVNINQGPAWCSGDKLATQFCLQRGSQRGRSRHRRAMSLDGVTGAPLSMGTNEPLLAGAPPETRGGGQGQGQCLGLAARPQACLNT